MHLSGIFNPIFLFSLDTQYIFISYQYIYPIATLPLQLFYCPTMIIPTLNLLLTDYLLKLLIILSKKCLIPELSRDVVQYVPNCIRAYLVVLDFPGKTQKVLINLYDFPVVIPNVLVKKKPSV